MRSIGEATAVYLALVVDRARASSESRVRLAALVMGLLVLVVHGVRLRFAPDMFGDEGLYFLVGRNLARGAGLLDDSGTFFWHPPLYPVLEAAYIQLTGSLREDFATALLDSRWINVTLSAATAALLVLFGRRLRDLRAGLLMATLFLADLFVQRINRRSMIETLAVLLVLLALFVFLPRREGLSRNRVVACGVLFGVALLTKEVTVIGLMAVAAYVFMFRRSLARAIAAVAAIAAAIYSVYPIWAFAIGEGDRFLAFKLGAVTRIFGVTQALVPRNIRAGPQTNPGVAVRLVSALGDYGPSYILIALGAVLTVVVLVRYRRRAEAQFVGCWSAVSYAFVGAGQLGGFGDQFFYYVIVPAIVIVSYLVSLEWDRLTAFTMPMPWSTRIERWTGHQRLRPTRAWRAVAHANVVTIALALALAFDGVVWVARDVVGTDNSYAEIAAYVDQHVPAGSTIVVGGDVSNFLFRPTYRIEFYRDRRSVLNGQVKFFILSSKEAAQGYNRLTPDFYDWVLSNSRPLVERYGETFWTLGLYEWTPVTASPAPTVVSTRGESADRRGR